MHEPEIPSADEGKLKDSCIQAISEKLSCLVLYGLLVKKALSETDPDKRDCCLTKIETQQPDE